MKTKKLYLERNTSPLAQDKPYRVIKTINMMNPKAGTDLSEDEATKYNKDRHVVVTITAPK